MFYINDLVRVTERAKKDTYDNAWWTDKDLLVESMELSEDLKEDNQYIYSFTTVDGEEVPCSLYDYELELVKSVYPVEIRERLNHKYEFVEYEVDNNIDAENETLFLVDIFNSILENKGDINSRLKNAFQNTMEYSMEDILTNYVYYIKDYINEYIRDYHVSDLEDILDGGVKKYSEEQYFNNRVNIYENVLYSIINKKIDFIKTSSNIDTIKDESLVFLNFETDSVEDFVNIFVYDNISILEEKNTTEIYELFSEFLLENLKSEYSSVIEERLNHKYEFVDYSVEFIIDEDRELEFLDDVFNSIVKDEFDIDSLITNSIDKVNPCSLEDSLSYYGYELEDYIDRYMEEKRPKTLEDAMRGGIYNYLKAQYLQNKDSIYINLLNLILNNKIKYISISSNEDILNSDSCIFIKFDTNDVEKFINDFVNENLDILDTKEVPEIYSMFCNFLKTKK